MLDSDGKSLEKGGYYWVQIAAGEDWEPCEWCAVYGWFPIGYEEAHRQAYRIGPRIMPPEL